MTGVTGISPQWQPSNTTEPESSLHSIDRLPSTTQMSLMFVLVRSARACGRRIGRA